MKVIRMFLIVCLTFGSKLSWAKELLIWNSDLQMVDSVNLPEDNLFSYEDVLSEDRFTPSDYIVLIVDSIERSGVRFLWSPFVNDDSLIYFQLPNQNPERLELDSNVIMGMDDDIIYGHTRKFYVSHAVWGNGTNIIGSWILVRKKKNNRVQKISEKTLTSDSLVTYSIFSKKGNMNNETRYSWSGQIVVRKLYEGQRRTLRTEIQYFEGKPAIYKTYDRQGSACLTMNGKECVYSYSRNAKKTCRLKRQDLVFYSDLLGCDALIEKNR